MVDSFDLIARQGDAAQSAWMTDKPSPDVEMTMVLPLGVIASKLRRIEAELRLLNLKASSFADLRHSQAAIKRIDAQIEQIDDVLESIKRLAANLEFAEPRPSTGNHLPGDDEYSPTRRKPRPELDD